MNRIFASFLSNNPAEEINGRRHQALLGGRLAQPTDRAIRTALRVHLLVGVALQTRLAARRPSPSSTATLVAVSSTSRVGRGCGGCLGRSSGRLRGGGGGLWGYGSSRGLGGSGRLWCRRSLGGNGRCLGCRRRSLGSHGGGLGCGCCGWVRTSRRGGWGGGASNANVGTVPELLGVRDTAGGQGGLPPRTSIGNVSGLSGAPGVVGRVASVSGDPPPLQHASLARQV